MDRASIRTDGCSGSVRSVGVRGVDDRGGGGVGVVHHDGGPFPGSGVVEVQALGAVVAPQQGALVLAFEVAALAHPSVGFVDGHVEEDRVVPEAGELVPVEERAFDDDECVLGCLDLRGADRGPRGPVE